MNKLLPILLLILLVGCGKSNIDFQDIENQAWKQEEPIRFTIKQSDIENSSSTLYIRHTDAYPFQNLWLKLSFEPADSLSPFERHEIQLAQPDGRWLGKRSGAFYTVAYPLTNFTCASDTCRLLIEQNMRANPLLGIQSVGLSFEE